MSQSCGSCCRMGKKKKSARAHTELSNQFCSCRSTTGASMDLGTSVAGSFLRPRGRMDTMSSMPLEARSSKGSQAPHSEEGSPAAVEETGLSAKNTSQQREKTASRKSSAHHSPPPHPCGETRTMLARELSGQCGCQKESPPRAPRDSKRSFSGSARARRLLLPKEQRLPHPSSPVRIGCEL